MSDDEKPQTVGELMAEKPWLFDDYDLQPESKYATPYWQARFAAGIARLQAMRDAAAKAGDEPEG